MYKYKALIFDWDGTLFNSMHYKRSNFIRIFTELGVNEDEIVKCHAEYSGLPRRILFNNCYIKFFGKDIQSSLFDELSIKYTEINIASSKDSSLFPEVIETLKELKNIFSTYISSSASKIEILNVIQRTGIGSYFKDIMGSDGMFTKGEGHFDRVKSDLNCNSDQLLFVGDDEKDFEIASKSGVNFIRIKRNACNKASIYPVIKSLSELKNFIIYE